MLSARMSPWILPCHMAVGRGDARHATGIMGTPGLAAAQIYSEKYAYPTLI